MSGSPTIKSFYSFECQLAWPACASPSRRTLDEKLFISADTMSVDPNATDCPASPCISCSPPFVFFRIYSLCHKLWVFPPSPECLKTADIMPVGRHPRRSSPDGTLLNSWCSSSCDRDSDCAGGSCEFEGVAEVLLPW